LKKERDAQLKADNLLENQAKRREAQVKADALKAKAAAKAATKK
jgi:hypothetical protein